ncbi:trypsin-like peptidase domain-containing protein [Actinoplanes sp. CA-030573]|uniref:trypsin-like peptidase domain-containing protein n=1 Tax=Actinoplanes sp. CA-030573 TaxID=3239898 RepID=UPI003D8FCB8A
MSFHDLAGVLDALRDAAAGVVKVYGGGWHVGTGWLITDELVVFPKGSISARSGTHYFCEADGAEAPRVGADVVFEPPGESTLGLSEPALLRLHEPIPGGRPLPLVEGSTLGHSLFVLHYPSGSARQQVSFGRWENIEAGLLTHDGATTSGSSGGPIVNVGGSIVAMTTLRIDNRSCGPTLAAMLEVLRTAGVWPEIAAYHRLADIAAAHERLSGPRPTGDDGGLLWAAVRWSFDPTLAGDTDRELLAKRVHDIGASRWTLRSRERRALIEAATVERLREARGDEPEDDPRQAVIDRILCGPPFAPDEAELPHWLQAVRWFGGVVDGLPTPADITESLERRRLRGRLTAVAGPDFEGRADELQTLQRWYGAEQPPPLVVTGIGGIGKSALLARFALTLPEETPLFWLDFDRADLSPDDADSVLAQLTRQAAVQFDGLEPGGFARALAHAARDRPAPLLVLDGFEVAQHVRRHGELWLLLEEILREATRLRVVVSGRAAVPGLSLLGRDAGRLALTGLDRTDAASWLRRHGIIDDRVVDLAAGIPLALHLAVRFVATGGRVEDLPVHLPQAMIEGLLYTRILERVMDADLMPIARDALVLRRLNVDMVASVLAGSIPEGMDAAGVFERLSRELSLVDDNLDLTVGDGQEELRLRPDLRAAALTLLELDDPARVRAIDHGAAIWYEMREPTAVNTAELVYHRLRLGDVERAATAWRDECAPMLADAGNELPPGARLWLHVRTTGQAARHAEWETDAVVRIERALSRGRGEQAVAKILDERRARNPGGPLTFYDAWLRWRRGDAAGAADILARSAGLGRNEAILSARLASEAGDVPSVDRLLAAVQSHENRDPLRPDLLSLLAWAARVRLTVDLPAERAVAEAIGTIPGLRRALEGYLQPADAVLDDLGAAMGPQFQYAALRIPRTPAGLEAFADGLRAMQYAEGGYVRRRDQIERWAASPTGWGAPDGSRVAFGLPDLPGRPIERALDLAVMSQRRRNLATADLMIHEVCWEARHVDAGRAPIGISVVASLAAYRCLPVSFEDVDSIDELLAHFLRALPFRLPEPTDDFSASLLRDLATKPNPNEWRAIGLYLLSRDPLERLVELAAGVPTRTA